MARTIEAVEPVGTAGYVETPAGRIRVWECGSGTPLVFVHGLLTNSLLWRKVVPTLAEHHRCIVPDWPLGSHPEAMRADADLSPDGLVALIVAVLDGLGLEQAVLVGNDTGGALSQLVAARHPDRVDGPGPHQLRRLRQLPAPHLRPAAWWRRGCRAGWPRWPSCCGSAGCGGCPSPSAGWPSTRCTPAW